MERSYVLQVTYYEKNYGSALQAYAMQQFLDEYGIDCILISENYSFCERLYRGLMRRLSSFPKELLNKEFRIEKKRQLDANRTAICCLDKKSDSEIQNFIADELRVRKLTYKEMKRLSRGNGCRFCFAGSDQIWNGARVYFNPLYFLSFAPKGKRISIAPSFGTNKIKGYNIRRYRNAIRNFEKLSVREKSGIDIIKNLTGKDAIMLLDPVFLLSQNKWRQVAQKSKNCEIKDKYVLAFFLNPPSSKAIGMLCHLYAEGLKIVTIGYASNLVDVNVPIIEINGGPKEYLNLIDGSSVICTDSFHATAFSAILEKPFYVFERNYVSTKQSTRIIEFLSRMGLTERFEPEVANIEESRIELFTCMRRQMAENREQMREYLNLSKII